ncbi:hypothetical protein OS493_012156 [Desmophyllum pertusum]|uniref:Uncharacterized protein n=1 Tax=Desmophyllum pertusum TaxID=174260 RepID=A0A9X0DA78_9CNID|nr:hypothetical protein OS493_012156 [Desmophyllum pertusum]
MKMADYRSSSRKDGKYQVNLTNCNIQTVVIGDGTTVNTCCRRAERSTASRSGPTVIQDGGEWRGTKRKQKLLVDNTSVKEFVTMDIIVICILYLIIVTIHVHVSCRYQPTLESLDSRPLHSWYAEFKFDPDVWAEPLTKSDARYPQALFSWNYVINGRHRNRAGKSG